ncbi:FAD-dependent oxidoreductase [Streptomyces sp. NBC_01433]|uniref:NAD(P)/FAD-dependent oxidoreductase n=1 Tax=Streptomyces sp. NBC_01433 TaxID=2903864 RepID=UPI00225044CC|nr:FAD-dependent oxidoreductase [Streptomyces sp. NBC_01433]MCX4676431.1 FAD-dependent oxidoreductase [Streptomyces sp. NBC_01433]
MTRVAIIGGGISGLAAALFLGRRGHSVTVFERDAHRPGEHLEQDFFDWHRPGVPQSVQPHGLLAPVRTVLLTETPDVYEAMLRRGAAERHEMAWFPTTAQSRKGDEDLVTVQTRRIVLEAALHDAVEREPDVGMRRGDPATGLALDRKRGTPWVTGVRSASGTHPADLVLDAGGRRSPVTGWLAAAGCRDAVVENHRIGIAYFCRWYRLRADGPRNPGRVRNGSASAFAVGGVFPSDNGTLAVSLTVSTADPTRALLRDPAVFERVAGTFPAVAAWLALEPEPVSDVLAMGGLDNRWTSLVDDRGPVVAGLVGVGDSVMHTNPTMGQGVALGLRAGQWIGRHAQDASKDPVSFAEDYHRWSVRTLRPWFDGQVAADRANAAQLGDAASPSPTPPTGASRETAARAACSLDDPVVMRARAQVRHLVLTEEQAYGTEEVRAHLARWLEEHPHFTPSFDGPGRTEWESAAGLEDTAAHDGKPPV